MILERPRSSFCNILGGGDDLNLIRPILGFFLFCFVAIRVLIIYN